MPRRPPTRVDDYDAWGRPIHRRSKPARRTRDLGLCARRCGGLHGVAIRCRACSCPVDRLSEDRRGHDARVLARSKPASNSAPKRFRFRLGTRIGYHAPCAVMLFSFPGKKAAINPTLLATCGVGHFDPSALPLENLKLDALADHTKYRRR